MFRKPRPFLQGTAVPNDVLHDGVEWNDTPAPTAPAQPRVHKRIDLLTYAWKAMRRALRMEKRILRRKVRIAAGEQRKREIQEAKEYIGIQ